MGHRRRLILSLVLAGAVTAGAPAYSRAGRDRTTPGTATTSTSTPAPPPPATAAGDVQAAEVDIPERPRGGSARVGVWAAPDPGAPTFGGAAVRALVLPQLFVARPDGRWSPGVVKPGTDRLADDRRSASFRFRDGASWSEGSPIGVEDLRRSADARFVAGVDDPAPDGTVVVRFTQELPGWRRLWSGTDAISPPADGVWGGAFVVAAQTPGLETVLHRNERSWWPRGPFLDEVRLVLVPDPTTARELLARGELDALMPLATTVRTPQLERIAGVSVDRVARGGWSVSLLANPTKLSLEDRRAVFATVDRATFVTTLLGGEATLLNGFAGPEDATWAGAGAGDANALKGDTVELVGFAEEPNTGLLHRAMQKRARGAGGSLELRAAEADRVGPWLTAGDYAAGIAVRLDPLGECWRCRWEPVDAGLASAADAGDGAAVGALQAKLRDEALVLPLWRPETVVAWRAGLNGPRANGYAASAAWNAWEWWRS